MRELEVKIDKNLEGKTLEKILRENLGLTKKEISRAKFQPQGIRVNGEKQRITYRPLAGQVLRVCTEEQNKEKSRVMACEGELQILYEDRDLLVLEKQGGTPCHPGRGHFEDSLGNRAAAYLKEQGEDGVVRAVGRLDKDTSGVMVYAKSRIAAARLSAQKQTGEFQKVYFALVKGEMKEKEGKITCPIAPIPGEKLKMQVQEGGKSSCTQYEVLEKRKSYTFVKCRISTGRTHQIRVHMAWLGYPLLGDVLYGDGQNPLFEGLALYAAEAEFSQSFTKERICVWGKYAAAYACVGSDWK